MASSAHRLQPTFSIEQIELIRRLRNSGLTKEQLLQAFESLERIDSELGNLYTVPISLSQAKSFAAAPAQVREEAGMISFIFYIWSCIHLQSQATKSFNKKILRWCVR